MTWIACQEEFDARPGGDREDGHRDYTRSFYMTTDDPTDDAATALASGLLPSRFLPHPRDAGAIVLRRQVRPIPDTQLHWRATIEYSTDLGSAKISSGMTASGGEAGGGAEGGGSPEKMADTNPLARDPDISFDSETVEEAIDNDFDGFFCGTAAGEPFDPPFVEQRELLAMDITRNLNSFNPELIASYTGAINEVAFLGFAPYEVLLRKMKCRFKKEHGVVFAEVYARFVFNPKIALPTGPGGSPQWRGTWLRKVWHAGYDILVSGQRTRYQMPNGQWPTRPVFLNNDATAVVTAENRVTQSFRTKHRRDFNTLNLF